MEKQKITLDKHTDIYIFIYKKRKGDGKMNQDDLQANFFKAIAHPLRIKILSALSKSDRCVCDMAKTIGEGQPQVSRALAQLKQAGLVVFEKKGTKTCYRLKSREAVKLLDISGAMIRDESEKVMSALAQKQRS
jgi:DNA-binding transcriptional ArsR family regulator